MSDNPLIVYTQQRGLKPSFHDGRCSYKTYLIIAAYQDGKSDAYNCIGIRPLGNDEYRVHAYPDFNHFGLTMEKNTYHRRKDINGRYGYEGAYLNEKDITDMLAVLRFKRGVQVANLEGVFETAKLGYHPTRAVAVAYDEAA